MKRKLLVSTFCVAAMGRAAAALPPPEQVIDENEAKLTMDAALSQRDSHPPFVDAITKDSANAAARYVAIWRGIGPRLDRAPGSIQLFATTFEIVDEEIAGTTAAAYRELLERLQPDIAELLAASRLERFETYESALPCRRPLDPSDPRQGLSSSMRKIIRTLRDESVRRWTTGDRDGAIACTAAIIRIGEHASHQPTLIGNLVADSIIQYGIAAANCFLDDATHPVSAAARADLLAALNRLDAADPALLHRAWKRNWECGSRFVETELADGTVGQDLLIDLAQLHGGLAVVRRLTASLFEPKSDARNAFAVPDPIAAAIAQASDDGPAWLKATCNWKRLRARADRAKELFVLADAAWEKPDAEETLRPIDKEIDADESGLLLTLVGVPRQMYKSCVRGKDTVRCLKQRLESLDVSPK